ncbi:MAG: DNA-directed RNA polymerase subunit beta' [Alphaproteobacteria bacterium RIFCSPLOWO2_01_FULL_40_26]|nr:MAG: DNA-directed RNA polymerase subunit beta' [Alphaproteobacteria bacterium RIFCSPHIGHO2_02_FULL_40_34]OFW94570.1 MAG: DNA-directed RNA polymerase subunit beta' [Alphaproteobacteria bacterium RIFCSPLOWO2_01_FULL_40_26]OFX10322.1 MAG: DNA-directed RNA polymerase subunit beta' [Alphaproteobacteria bacterium RIFCSPLOWO2_02_FULL_40_19]OFX11919.1 MAG: DNA-directed RNA polymerase subunit beta' [Alphaproteobacteria bacterium RIFCSPLOWO2_12_FULL_40_11]
MTSNNAVDLLDFNAIKISIADPDKIRSWSFGEVAKPETINYRTFKPERDGLFCARIFGPIKDYECLCGKYKRIKYKGIVCEKCGVEVTSSKVRRERMGHIELAAPVSHIWFLKSLPSRIATILGVTLKSIEKVIYFESYVITDGLMSPLKDGEIITEDELEKFQQEHGYGSFIAETGAEAVQKLLQKIDLKKLQKELREELVTITSELKREKTVKRLKLIEQFVDSGSNRPEHMIISVLPVIPPDIRPLVMLDGGRFATSDLNELYRRVINRNNRLKRLTELGAPEIIIKNEKRMLQESVDALLDNGRSGAIVKNSNKKPFKSLADMLKGKQGRFRQNLLGKRVDYSGRSVIVVGPELKLHQCGLPKKMALELFKPFIYSKLELYGKSPSIKVSKKLVEAERPEVWDILDEVIKEHPVLLNRAPTLHRLGIQAFEPVLTEGKAIQLHPLVCAAFNADFDGDQMAVHVPLSIEAQVEARVLMMSTNNILSPANGKPIIVPSQDIVLGLYYITMESKDFAKAKSRAIADDFELHHALNAKSITLHDKILYRYVLKNDAGERFYSRIETTPGRVLVYNILPNAMKRNFDAVNKAMTKKAVTNLIDTVYRNCGQKETVMFCDRIMALGFKNACVAGISIGKDDMIIPQGKQKHITESLEKVKKLEKQYRDGLITSGERYNKVVDEWTNCTNKISREMMSIISSYTNPSSANSIFMMADSGARGSENQIKQVAGMRGLMAKPSGEIIETPITSNFKEGLSVLEYFISAHGARKGLADTALKTANSGYLTRRLVDVSQDCIVIEEDCGTDEGVIIEPVIEDGRTIVSLGENCLGRVPLEDIKSPDGKKTIAHAGTMIDEALADAIEQSGVKSIKSRSVLTCKSHDGICVKCYGRDLATGDIVSIGEAAGVIAAQSIGEPGTQLTMRTFHIGGAAQRGTEQSSISAISDGKVRISDKGTITDRDGKIVVVSRNSEITLVDKDQKEIHSYKLPYGSVIIHKHGSEVKKGDHLAEWDPYNIPVIAEATGAVKFNDLTENVSLREKIDESSGVSTKIVIDWKQYSKQDLKPRLSIVKGRDDVLKEYALSISTVISVSNGDEVKTGDVIARIPKESSKTRDITGGLPRVAELFEARKPKNAAVISEIDGYVEFGKDYKTKRRIIIRSQDASVEPAEYSISKSKHLFVGEGDFVKKGDTLVDGNLVPHDILRILGMQTFTNYMVNEVQKVYRMQGVKIDDKHIEVILSMMLKRVEVTYAGDTTLLAGEYVDRDVFEEVNQKMINNKMKPAKCAPVLLGITKASLQTKSFISAASFQETTRVLTDSAVQGKIDHLRGLKENIIVGRLIPAGTGLMANKYRKIANQEKKLEEAVANDKETTETEIVISEKKTGEKKAAAKK